MENRYPGWLTFESLRNRPQVTHPQVTQSPSDSKVSHSGTVPVS